MTEGTDGDEHVSGEVQHTQEEIVAFNERTETIGDYAQLVEMAIQDTVEEAGAHPGKAGMFGELLLRSHWLQGLLIALVVGLILVVAAFFATGTDFTEILGGGDADPQATDGAVDTGASGSETADGEADADSAAAGTGGDATNEADPALAPELLDLAVQVADGMGAYNAAASAGDKKAEYETAMAIRPLASEFIQSGGSVQMPDFLEAYDEWMRAADRYVSGNAGAVAELEAAHEKAVQALDAYAAASESAP